MPASGGDVALEDVDVAGDAAAPRAGACARCASSGNSGGSAPSVAVESSWFWCRTHARSAVISASASVIYAA
jgi:hypothetical protein